ncbi:BlaI/MecI/CopY family transcriptional regulator [Anaerotignum sp.]|uniref:BlaI/MecI/CopY family transcriptional regulator n=1 Tax=Anaerotignum sp. TaxID=2039241 RepID=UPI0028971393|nr:BlaI/MecI/CopY family transcriptional regulator [Anaerotignum sp.]
MRKMSESEMEVMQVVWGHKNPLTNKEIISLIPNNQWKVTTVLTLISRLIDKGFLKVAKEGRVSLYSYIVSEDEYRRMCSKNFLDEFYQGSFKNFFAALYSADELSQEDFDELREILDKREDVE